LDLIKLYQIINLFVVGTEPELEVRGAILLLVAFNGSNFRFSCL